MKYLMITMFLLSIAFGTQAQNSKAKKKSKATSTKASEVKDAPVTFEKAEISFVDKDHNFGDVLDGPEAVYVFKFYNVGKEPLTLSGAQPSCSCTVSDYTHEPVMPGKSGSITVKYGTKGRMGSFTKSVTVTSNAITNPISLTITGTVIASPQETH